MARRTSADVPSPDARTPGKNCAGDVKDVGDDGFFALLGTVHGTGPGRMLATYPHGHVLIQSRQLH
jgi:hypothetical protein